VPRLARRWRPEAPPRSPLERHRERLRAGLVPAEPWMLTAITPRPDPDLLAASQAAVAARHADEDDRGDRDEWDRLDLDAVTDPIVAVVRAAYRKGYTDADNGQDPDPELWQEEGQ
jgi:hypothetical protein